MASGLDRLLSAIRACRICVDDPQGPKLPHEPRPVLQVSPKAPILIVGQAPGTRVHASGRPFTDASGVRLRSWLGVEPEAFYDPSRFAVVPMGFCFPGQDAAGGDLPPRKECASAWRARLMAELPAIRLIVCLGHYAQRWHMGEKAGETLSETVANWRAGLRLSPAVIPLPHPSWRNNAWLKRNPWFESELLPVLRERVAGLLACGDPASGSMRPDRG
jgi:uracil-DNA glycosylase